MTEPVRVLVVDDSATIRRVVGAVLQRAGHDVATAESGEVGLREAATFLPDIILLDFIMPGMNGYQFLKRLDVERLQVGGEEVPVVLMCTRGDQVAGFGASGVGENGVDGTLRAVGVVDVITKPFSPEALLAVVHHSLEKHGRRRGSRDTTRVVAALASILPQEISDAASEDAASDDDGDDDRGVEDDGDDAARDDDNDVSADDLFPMNFALDEATEQTVPVHLDQLGARTHSGGGRAVPDTDDRATVISGHVAPSANVAGNVGGASRGGLLVPQGFALCGDLTVIALPEVLQLLKFQSQTGLLLVDAGGLRFEMSLENGAVVALHARDPDGSPARRGDLLLGRYFVAAGLVDEAALEVHLSRPGPRPIGERLVAAGVITSDELRRAVGDQTQDLMVELLRARRGVFALQAGPAHLPAVVARPGWSVDVLMFEALRQVDEWAVIETEVPSFEARFAIRLANSGAVDDSGLSPEENAVLRQLKNGPLAVRDVVKRSPLRPFDVCRMLYRLAVLKRVRRIDDGDSSRLVSEDSGPAVPLLSTLPREVP